MSGVESFVVFFPRHSTLVGLAADGGSVSFASIPLDVSKYGGVQLEAWLGEATTVGETPELKIFLEESLDGAVWPEAMSTEYSFDLGESYKSKFFSFGFRLRWFRVRIQAKFVPLFTCYVEGILRAGGGGGREWILAKPEPATRADLGPNAGPAPALPGRSGNSMGG